MSKIFSQYESFVSSFARLHRDAQKIPLGDFAETSCHVDSDVKIMLFSPHPDDECVVGGLPLRFHRELKARVINVAVTLGSNEARKQERRQELTHACKSLGFELMIPGEKALDSVNPATKGQNKTLWAEQVKTIRAILCQEQPQVILFPHDNDFNSTHIGTHLLLKEAIELTVKTEPSWQTVIIESEFWHMMEKPNLMIGLSHQDEARLVYALSAHTGEVERNPYHINHPARALDNVTRGSEVVGGQGGQAVDFDFAMIYRCSVLKEGKISSPWKSGRVFAPDDSLNELLALL